MSVSRTIETGATFSPCRIYRYTLTRRWWKNVDLACWIMLNPSTASETVDDPTVTRCSRRAAQLGYGGIVVVNLFALRSTSPRVLLTHKDPIGPNNDAALMEAATSAGIVICGWGNHGTFLRRGATVESMLRRAGVALYALKISKTGQPGHPLYVGYDVKPKLWEIESRF